MCLHDIIYKRVEPMLYYMDRLSDRRSSFPLRLVGFIDLRHMSLMGANCRDQMHVVVLRELLVLFPKDNILLLEVFHLWVFCYSMAFISFCRVTIKEWSLSTWHRIFTMVVGISFSRVPMAGMPNQLAACPNGGTIWLATKVLFPFAAIDDNVVEGEVFPHPTMGTKCSYRIW